MGGPDWFRWLLTVLFVAVGAYCVARLAAARHVPARYRACHRATDLGHGMMSAGMAVMCSPAGGPVPVAGWQTIFLVTTAWFGASWLRQQHSPAEEPGWQCCTCCSPCRPAMGTTRWPRRGYRRCTTRTWRCR